MQSLLAGNQVVRTIDREDETGQRLQELSTNAFNDTELHR